MADSNGSAPVIDMARGGRRWSREWQRIHTDFAEAQAALQRHGIASDNDAELTADQSDEVVRLMRMIDDASGRQDGLVAQVLVSVPDDWLTTNAPGAVEICAGELVDHIREARWPDVIAAVQEARMDGSKN